MPLRLPSVVGLFLATAACALPQLALAATLTIAQTSELEAVASWTLSKPDHTVLDRTDKSLTIPDLPAGLYTVFVQPPEGETTAISVMRSGTLLKEVALPQVTFDLAADDTASVAITLTLTNFGKVGVSSDPAAMPFQLQGPDGIKREGVTPTSFERMPTGNYSVKYVPAGCPTPPAKSDALKKNGAVYFSVTLTCETFEPELQETEETQVGAEVKGELVMFTDVPKNAWYAPFVSTVSRRGILTGYKNSAGHSTGLFGPGNPVTTAELAKIVHEMAEIDELGISAAPINPGAFGKWFTKYVASAEQRGWAIYQNPSLDLARPATRGEVMVTLLQVLDMPLKWQTGQAFTDVTLRTPYAHAIETAAAEGIVSGATGENGKSTGEFRPSDPITRAEMAKILITIQEKYQSEPVLDE